MYIGIVVRYNDIFIHIGGHGTFATSKMTTVDTFKISLCPQRMQKLSGLFKYGFNEKIIGVLSLEYIQLNTNNEFDKLQAHNHLYRIYCETIIIPL